MNSFWVFFYIYTFVAAVVPDAEYINSYVGILSLCRLVFQHARMQPALQMVWPHYLKPFKSNKTSPARQTRIFGGRKNSHLPLFIRVTVSQEVLTVRSLHPVFIEAFNGLRSDGRHITFMCPLQSNLSPSSCSVTALTQ